MTIVFFMRMYDPQARKTWWRPHRIEAKSKAEFKAKVRELRRRYPRWTGER